jgi:hypothetical protein
MDQEALKMAHEFELSGVEPIAEYIAVAGPGYGWVKVWTVEEGYLVYWGDNGEDYAVFEEYVDLEDLAEWIEWDDVGDLGAIEQRANVRGAAAVPEAKEGDEGPFYILETRHWYGPTETSSLIVGSNLEPLEFTSFAEAKEWIEEEDGSVYYLAHNESCRPTYKVVTV